jgi:hypothetical protein
MHDNSLKNLRPWQQGQTGNPNGRPTARSRLTERFIADVSQTWAESGASILKRMAAKEPTRFADLCSRLIPKDVTLSLEARLPGNLAPADWDLVMELLQAIKQALPDAGEQRPGDVLNFALEALRSYSAKVVDGQDSD